MPTRKKATKAGKKSTKKAGTRSARIETGSVPPYGEVIRGAVARGDVQEMRNIAANARKWMTDVKSALSQLDSAIKKSGS